MDKKNIAVIFGGVSPEYGVSLKSAAAVLAVIDRDLYDVTALGITPSGEWYRYFGSIDNIPKDNWQDERFCEKVFISPDRKTKGIVGYNNRVTPLDAVFPVMHGENGEDGAVHGLLQLAGIPIVGCPLAASSLCMDKELSHIVAANAGVKIPRGFTLYSGESLETHTLDFPLFVKPARTGSSYGISCVYDRESLQTALDNAFKYDEKVIVEEKIIGFEVGCAIIGFGENLVIGAVDEIELHGDLFDFNEKYTLKTAKIHVPARISTTLEKEIKNTAKRIYNALGCSGFARVDMFVTGNGNIVFNEVNTIPGLTEHSRFPKMLENAGYPFSDVINLLIRNTLDNSAGNER